MWNIHVSSCTGRKGSGPPRSSASFAVSILNLISLLLVSLVFKAIFLLTFFGALQKKYVVVWGRAPTILILTQQNIWFTQPSNQTTNSSDKVRVSPRQATSFLKAAKKEAKIGFFISAFVSGLHWSSSSLKTTFELHSSKKQLPLVASRFAAIVALLWWIDWVCM